MKINIKKKHKTTDTRSTKVILFVMGIRKMLLFVTFCFAATISVAQQIKSVSSPDSYRTVNWTVQDGLSAFGMFAMIKDSKGFLWIGSTNLGGALPLRWSDI